MAYCATLQGISFHNLTQVTKNLVCRVLVGR